MSGIFGILRRRGGPVDPELFRIISTAMADWGPDGGGTWLEGCCGLGQALLHNTPEAVHERLPRWEPEARVAFTAEARIDNREALLRELEIPPSRRPSTPDGDLVLKAYLKWGEDCPDHLLGDWSFAAWHPDDRRLFLARDHHGNTALYTWAGDDYFAFASGRKALLALPIVPKVLNEFRLAQILVSWPGDGIETVHQGIESLPPAHTATVTPDRFARRRYWYLEDTPLLRYPRSEDYVEGLREVLAEAVRCRLRSLRPVGATLSGGLDSGSVVGLAGPMLAAEGKTLPTFSSVPLFDVSKTVSPLRFGDETPYIRATAEHVGNVEAHLLDSAGVGPVAGLLRKMEVQQSPTHAAGNAYWIVDILERARGHGLGTLLTGQGGNASISWIGVPWIPPGTAPESLRNWKLRLKYDWVLPRVPDPALRLWIRLRRLGRARDWSHTAIREEFARRIDLAARRDASDEGPLAQFARRRDPRQMRYAIIKPGSSEGGLLWAEQGAACRLEVRDPTLDKRVLEYTIAVPNAEFTGPDAVDRYLLRRAMRGLLPPAVLDTPRRGRQAADLVERLRTEGPVVESALASVRGARFVNEYLDCGRLADYWRSYQTTDAATAEQTHRAMTVFTRGLMAALFLLRFEDRERAG